LSDDRGKSSVHWMTAFRCYSLFVALQLLTSDKIAQYAPQRHQMCVFLFQQSWSVPGVQGTVLNIGLNETNCKNLASHYGLQFALDTYARHLMSFGTMVLGATPNEYNSILDSRRGDNRYGYTLTDLEHIVEQFKRVRAVPEDPWEQVS